MFVIIFSYICALFTDMSVKFVLALVAVLAALAVTDARRAYASDYVNAYYSRQKVALNIYDYNTLTNQHVILW